MARKLWQYIENLFASLQASISCVQKLSKQLQQLEYSMFSSSFKHISISAMRSQHFYSQEKGYCGYTPHGTLWFYLHDHREDFSTCNGKPNLNPPAHKKIQRFERLKSGFHPLPTCHSSPQKHWPFCGEQVGGTRPQLAIISAAIYCHGHLSTWMAHGRTPSDGAKPCSLHFLSWGTSRAHPSLARGWTPAERVSEAWSIE